MIRMRTSTSKHWRVRSRGEGCTGNNECNKRGTTRNNREYIRTRMNMQRRVICRPYIRLHAHRCAKTCITSTPVTNVRRRIIKCIRLVRHPLRPARGSPAAILA